MERPPKHFLNSFLPKEVKKVLGPTKVQRVHCPTCGSYAERYHQDSIVKTQCSHCDYLMTTCAETGRVVEAYAPSFSPAALAASAAA